MSKWLDKAEAVLVKYQRTTLAVAAFLLGVLLVLLAGCSGPIPPAEGQTVVDTLAWTNPTTRTDGSPLTNLATLRIQYGAGPGGPFNLGQVDVVAPATTRNITRAVNVGTICYIVSAIDVNGVQSAPSNSACKTVVANPSPVTGLTVS